MRKKRAITLLEIMIVILLIGLIGGVVSYNLKGTLDKGKAFSSKEGAQKLEDILNLEIQAQSLSAASVVADPAAIRSIVTKSGLVSTRQVDKFLKDGWGESFVISHSGNEITVTSVRQKRYESNHSTEVKN